MLFSRVRDIVDNSLQVTTLNGHSIESVSEYKYLGIWLDQKIIFKCHIDTLASKLQQKNGYLYRNRGKQIFVVSYFFSLYLFCFKFVLSTSLKMRACPQ